jgi:hypothetical protein
MERKAAAMRYLMLLILLFPVGLQAQEVDKQKLIQILQLPRTAVNFSFSYELAGPSGAKFPGYDQVLKAEINTLKSQLKNQAADWKLWSTIAEKCSLLSDEGELAKCRVKELACLRRWVKEQPDDEKGQIELINVLLCNPKDFDEAFLRASELVKNHANSSNAWATLGYYHLQKNPLPSVVRRMRKQLPWHPMMQSSISLMLGPCSSRHR